MDEQVRTNRLRRKAARQGLYLRGSRRQDPDAPDFRRYRLVDADGPVAGFPVAGGSLDAVEAFLYRAESAPVGR